MFAALLLVLAPAPSAAFPVAHAEVICDLFVEEGKRYGERFWDRLWQDMAERGDPMPARFQGEVEIYCLGYLRGQVRAFQKVSSTNR